MSGAYWVTGYGQVHLGSHDYPSIQGRYPQIVHNLWKEEARRTPRLTGQDTAPPGSPSPGRPDARQAPLLIRTMRSVTWL